MLMQPVSKDYNNLEAMGFPEVLELVDVTQDVLDDVWKQTDFDKPYPEKRMRHFMEVIGENLFLVFFRCIFVHRNYLLLCFKVT